MHATYQRVEWESRTTLSLCVNAAVQAVSGLQPERRGARSSKEKHNFHFNLASAWRTSVSLTPILIPWLLLLQDRDRCSAQKRASPVIFYLFVVSPIPLLRNPCQSENMQTAQMWKMLEDKKRLTVKGTFGCRDSGGVITSTQPRSSCKIQDAFIPVPQFICSIHRKSICFWKTQPYACNVCSAEYCDSTTIAR